MSESDLWQTMRRGIGGLWEAERIENSVNTGTPDVAWSSRKVHGWFELKWTKEPPKRAKTPLRLDHYTTDQKNWILRHGKAGGRVFLFLQVADEFMLFDYLRAQAVGGLTMAELRSTCIWYARAQPDWEDLIGLVTRR